MTEKNGYWKWLIMSIAYMRARARVRMKRIKDVVTVAICSLFLILFFFKAYKNQVIAYNKRVMYNRAVRARAKEGK